MKGRGKTERLIRWSSVVTCGNPNIAADIRSRGAEAIVVPSAVDPRVFHPLRRPMKFPSSAGSEPTPRIHSSNV